MNKPARLLLGAVPPIAAVGTYYLWTSGSPSPFYPPLDLIWQRFGDLWLFERFGSDVVPSLRNLAVGFAIAVVVGLVAGVVIGRLKLLGYLLLPLITFGRSVPPIMLVPPLVLILGIGDSSKIAIIAFGGVFPVLIATIDGMRQADPALLDVTRSIGLSRLDTIRKVWVPAATPSVFGGVQTALQLSLVLMVASEMVAAYRGLGYITMQAQLTFDAPTVWAGIVLLAILGFVLNYLFTLVRRRVLAWHVGMHAVASAR